MNHTLKTMSTILLTIGLAFTATACGKQEAKEPDVIQEIETDCGIRSERGKRLSYAFGSGVDYDADTVQCLENHMPESVYGKYEEDIEQSVDYQEKHNQPLRNIVKSGGYEWSWRLIRGYSTSENLITVKKR